MAQSSYSVISFLTYYTQTNELEVCTTNIGINLHIISTNLMKLCLMD